MGKKGTTLKNFINTYGKKRQEPNKNGSTVLHLLSGEEIQKYYNKYGPLT